MNTKRYCLCDWACKYFEDEGRVESEAFAIRQRKEIFVLHGKLKVQKSVYDI